MSQDLPDLTEDQWRFLSLFEILNQPLPISLAGELVSLPPGPFLDVLRRATGWKWLEETAPDTYRLPSRAEVLVAKVLAEAGAPGGSRVTGFFSSRSRSGTSRISNDYD